MFTTLGDPLMGRYYVFYATLLYGEYASLYLHSFPDGVYIYEPKARGGNYWFLKDLTPVLIEDVPKELRALVLLMGV